MELLHSATFPSKQKLLIGVTIAIALFTFIPLVYSFVENPNFFLKQQPPSLTSTILKPQNNVVPTHENCDIFSGEWVPNPEGPYYTNTTCYAIPEYQNCVKYGRPDSDFMKWKWRPDGCEDGVPVFDPLRFLEIVRGKTMAIVGDSVSRNHIQSLICLLSRVEYPVDTSVVAGDYFKRWTYETYNFTIATFWAPFLVKSRPNPTLPRLTDLFDVYLDEVDESWTAGIGEFDYVIISSGHWHFRASIYYENRTMVGCHYCQLPNIIDLTIFYGYRKAFRTAFKAILDSENFNGVLYLRTFAPAHFEGGLWDEGGDCLRKRPYQRNKTQNEVTMKLHKIQLEEFWRAEKEAKKKGMRLRLLDTTQAMWLRPDGHPSRYGHLPEANVTSDCTHWCLPGPIDILNDFLLAMLQREEDKGLLAQVR